MSCISQAGKKKVLCGYYLITKGLVIQGDPLYVNNEQVTKGEWMFIAWDYKGVVVKDMLCAFEEI